MRSDEEAAKRLGARWDGKRKTWYVPDGVDPAPLDEWLPGTQQTPNIRAPGWCLASATRACWTTHSFYRMNHCEHCEVKLGDFETLEEPGTFYELAPGLDERKLVAQDLHQFVEPFSGYCGRHADVE